MAKKTNQQKARRLYLSEKDKNFKEHLGQPELGFFNENMGGEDYASIHQEANESVNEHNGTAIIQGKDSKYGSDGDTHASEVTLVAGVAAQSPVEHKFTGDDGTSTVYVRPVGIGKPFLSEGDSNSPPAPFCSDGATLSLGQKGDWHEKAGLRRHKSRPESKASSGLAAKADFVNFTANESMSFATNPHGYNSRGGRISSVPGIDFVAGGNAKALQPLVRGDNLRACLARICNQIRDLNGILHGCLMEQMRLNHVLGSHFHPPPVLNSEVIHHSLQQDTAFDVNAALIELGTQSLQTQLENIENLEKAYILPQGDRYINSRLNKTN